MMFPIYRKLINNKVFYKIIDSKNFEELQCMGSKVKHSQTTAIQYPELLLIQDLIATNEFYITSSQEEWEMWCIKIQLNELL
jgi:transglutaminase/protease-like cytokinesis protein 3